MVIDIIKGIVLVVFSFFLGILGAVAEICCVPISRAEGKLMVFDFIGELWIRSYKDYK